jgi:hypothetical protein
MDSSPLSEDARRYSQCMTDIRSRVDATEWLILTVPLFDKTRRFVLEDAIFVQFRKTLELIAFASLSAHREAYSAKHKNFEQHYKAKAMLDAIEALNPEFYPQALGEPFKRTSTHEHYESRKDALTKPEFERLYDACGDVMHSWNPYTDRKPVVDIGYPVAEWLGRIKRLIAKHAIRLLDGNLWLVHIPPVAPVTITLALPGGTHGDGPPLPEPPVR